MYALLSVSDKEGIDTFAKGLIKCGFKILSSSGTLRFLTSKGIDALEVSTYTQSDEIFDGRVKTLHPKIHGGILYRRENKNDAQCAKDKGIEPISLVCVNLYPFVATTQRTQDFDEIIENIDIGGPALIRSAAKNHKDVLVITDKDDYDEVLKRLANQQNTYEFRKMMMIKAYEHTASYDSAIANYFNKRFCDGFGEKAFIVGSRVFKTRYGENPHQSGALYEFESFFTQSLHIIKGEASFNNLTDINAAMRLATSFGNAPVVSIIKHNNPCGFALKSTLLDAYKNALACDSVSAYGGVVAVNGIVDVNLAEVMNKIFIEVLICGDITPEALKVFQHKKRMKIFTQNAPLLSLADDKQDFKHIQGGFLLQSSDVIMQNEISNAVCVTKKSADTNAKRDLEIAYIIATLTKSNSVAYVKECALVGIGMGMTSRIDASRAALAKAKDMGLDVNGCVLASEAFFPFADSIEMANNAGVRAIIQPGGSIRDEEVIKACDKYGIAMYFTGRRHFLH